MSRKHRRKPKRSPKLDWITACQQFGAKSVELENYAHWAHFPSRWQALKFKCLVTRSGQKTRVQRVRSKDWLVRYAPH